MLVNSTVNSYVQVYTKQTPNKLSEGRTTKAKIRISTADLLIRIGKKNHPVRGKRILLSSGKAEKTIDLDAGLGNRELQDSRLVSKTQVKDLTLAPAFLEFWSFSKPLAVTPALCLTGFTLLPSMSSKTSPAPAGART